MIEALVLAAGLLGEGSAQATRSPADNALAMYERCLTDVAVDVARNVDDMGFIMQVADGFCEKLWDAYVRVSTVDYARHPTGPDLILRERARSVARDLAARQPCFTCGWETD